MIKDKQTAQSIHDDLQEVAKDSCAPAWIKEALLFLADNAVPFEQKESKKAHKSVQFIYFH